MAEFGLITVLSAVGVLFLLGMGALAIVAKFFRQVDQGRALIINKMRGEPIVSFTGSTVLPVVNRAEVMDISLKTIEIHRAGKEGLICADNIRADIKVNFFVRVNKTADDVLKVAQAIGCERASTHDTLENLFAAKFSEALKTVGKRLEFEQLYTKRDEFKDQIIEVIGKYLNGYVLDDVAIDYLEQTPLESLDPQNILDAQGIRKITEITAGQAVQTNQLKQDERKAITKQNVQADEAVGELQRQNAENIARQQREIATVQAKEAAETARVQSEEHKKAELARVKQEEEVAIAEQIRDRQVEIAQKSREKAIAIEIERVERERALEQIAREREVELQRIEKEKALEVQRKEIADVVRSRIAVDRTVAEQEEAIKDLRTTADAKRMKDSLVIAAEAEAQTDAVKQVKTAEAAQESAKHYAKQKLTLAEAELEAADKHARAQIRLSEGHQATAAADGLAKARVREADAIALEKAGRAEAEVLRQKLLAQAQGDEQKGLVHARVQEAEAVAVEKQGHAQALAVREKLVAEAAGLSEKAAAMKALDEAGRGHEEFRLRLEQQSKIAIEQIHARREIAEAQAEVMAKAMASAKIQIVGGDGAFFDKFMNAVSLGHTIDGVVDHSETAKTLMRDYLEGNASFTEDVKQVLTRPAIDADTVQKLSVANALGKLVNGK